MGMAKEVNEHTNGKVRDLVVPIVVLVIATISALLGTGAQALAADNRPFTLIGAFEATDVTRSLVAGVVISLIVAFLMLIGRKIPGRDYRCKHRCWYAFDVASSRDSVICLDDHCCYR